MIYLLTVLVLRLHFKELYTFIFDYTLDLTNFSNCLSFKEFYILYIRGFWNCDNTVGF